MWFMRDFVWRCAPVLPLVYDSTLSFYELMCKYARKINELIEAFNETKSVVDRNKDAVLMVNSTQPDANGNVNLPTVSGVTSVCEVGADGNGNVAINAGNVGAIAKTDTALTDSTFTIDDAMPHGLCIVTQNNIMASIKGAIELPSENDFNAIANIFGQANVWGLKCGQISGNPFNLPTYSYASTGGITGNMYIAHCFAIPRTVTDTPYTNAEIDVVIMYNGTNTELLITFGYLEGYAEMLANRIFSFTGTIVKAVS